VETKTNTGIGEGNVPEIWMGRVTGTTHIFLFGLRTSSPLYSLRRNPLAQSPGQVIRPSDKWNFIGTSPNGQVNFLLLDLYIHDHQNVFSKEFNFIMTIFHVRGLFL
jgi:hypothetical protein